MPKKSNAKPRQIVVISDTHIGCQLALCPPAGFQLDNGGVYLPSSIQKKLWTMWESFWGWVDETTEGEPYDLIHNGDVIDGSHHNSTSQISHNLEDQRDWAINVLLPHVTRCRQLGGRYYHVRGTSAHVGESGCDEEAIAKTLEAEPNEDGQHARYDLWKDLDGSLIQSLHHVGTVSSAAYEATAVHKELTESYVEAARWGRRPPDMICRAHRHRFIQIMIPTAAGRAFAVVGPSWQLKTPFAFKVAGARISTPQIGGYIIKKTHGVLHTLERIWPIEPSKVEL